MAFRAVTVFLLLFLTNSTTYAGPALKDVEKHGCRNIWIPVADASSIARLDENGFNAATAGTWLLKGAETSAAPDDSFIIRESDIPKTKLDMVRAQARECAKRRMLYVPYFNQLADDEVRLLGGKKYRRVVDHTGLEGTVAPCPLERKDWFGFQLPQMLAFARILAEERCEGGVMLEAETYAAGEIYPGYWTERQSLCYCDFCWKTFVGKLPNGQAPGKELAPAERYPWLSANGLLWRYEMSERQELAKICRELAAEVRKVDPDILFGMYPYVITWYNDAIIEGFRSKDKPFLVYSSQEYYSGFGQLSAKRINHIKKLGVRYLYLGGLSVGSFRPQRLGLEMARLVYKADGFWLYWGGTLLADEKLIKIVPDGASEYTLREPSSRYWPQINRSNQVAQSPSRIEAETYPLTTLLKNVTFRGPEGKPIEWNTKNPPAFDGGAPPIDTERDCFVLDLGVKTPQPKAQAFEHIFQQKAGERLLFGANVRYEGDPSGARVGLGWSPPEYVDWRGHYYETFPFFLTPRDGWTWAVRPISPVNQNQQGWARAIFHTNPGRLLIRSAFLAPCSSIEIESEVLDRDTLSSWGKISWNLEGAERSLFTVDILDAETGQQLYADVPNGFDLSDIGRVYGLTPIKVKCACLVPAGDVVTLRFLKISESKDYAEKKRKAAG